MTSRREEPRSCWRGAAPGAAGGCFCKTETGATLGNDDAEAEASREKTMRFGLRGGDFAAPVLAAVGSRAALLLKGSCCFLVELLDVGERLK